MVTDKFSDFRVDRVMLAAGSLIDLACNEVGVAPMEDIAGTMIYMMGMSMAAASATSTTRDFTRRARAKVALLAMFTLASWEFCIVTRRIAPYLPISPLPS